MESAVQPRDVHERDGQSKLEGDSYEQKPIRESDSEKVGQELGVLEQMAVAEEVLADVSASLPPDARGLGLIAQESLHRGAEGP